MNKNQISKGRNMKLRKMSKRNKEHIIHPGRKLRRKICGETRWVEHHESVNAEEEKKYILTASLQQ
jgi:hypothetical protein